MRCRFADPPTARGRRHDCAGETGDHRGCAAAVDLSAHRYWVAGRPYWRRDGGLAFDLLSSYSGEPVMQRAAT